MELKQIVVNNGGMSQDLSVSKQDNKLAFENKNIRIQATDDGTLLSVTNLKTPKTIKTVGFGNNPKVILGSCITPDYLVLFAKVSQSPYSTVPDNPEDKNSWIGWEDYIYRIDLSTLETDEPQIRTLYSCNCIDGSLNFSVSSYFDTLYYEEGEKVKKVYWADNVNHPRVINLITPSERNGGAFESYTKNVFEFSPTAFLNYTDTLPKINISKNRNVKSELPSGVVQYFLTYYNKNGAESLIASASDVYTIDYSTRGATAEEVGMCAFDIEIQHTSLNDTFDYVRIYSAIRTSYNGPLIVKIVGDIEIDPNGTNDTVYKITDTGINQEQLQDGQLYFIGGSSFIAKTLTEKDETLFLGGIKTSTYNEADLRILKTAIKNNCFDSIHKNEDNKVQFSKVVRFNLTKQILNNTSQFGMYYPYKLQLSGGSKSYKTFKSGETYRFGVQFQKPEGDWSEVIWVGDVECDKKPQYIEETQTFIVNNAEFKMPDSVKDAAKALGFVNYRLTIADPENSNGRKIFAQGVLNPTLFTPGQRVMDAPYVLPSWTMRPRGGKAAYHHFEPLFSTETEGAELASYTPNAVVKTPQRIFDVGEHTSYDIGYSDGIQGVASRVNNLSSIYNSYSYANDPIYGSKYSGLSKEPTIFPSDPTLEAAEKVLYSLAYLTATGSGIYADRKIYTTPFAEYSDSDLKPGYIVTYVAVSYGNQLAVRSVKLYSDDINNNFYVPEEYTDSDNETSNNPKSYEVLCDYTATLLGASNKYGQIIGIRNASASTAKFNFGVNESGNTCYTGWEEAFENLGIDLRLIPSPETFYNLTKNVAGSYAKLIVGWIFGIIAIAVILAITIVFATYLAPASIAAIAGIYASLALIMGVSSWALISGYSDRKNLRRTGAGGVLTDEALKELLTPETYSKLEEFQKSLIARYFLPIFTTHDGVTFSGVTQGVADINYYRQYENSIFSKTPTTYTTQVDNQTNTYTTYPTIFKPTATRTGDWDTCSTWIQILPIGRTNFFNKQLKDTYNDYYVDESYLTLNSPDLGDSPVTGEKIGLRVVGTVPITSSYANIDTTVNSHIVGSQSGLDYYTIFDLYRRVDSFEPFYSDFIYQDAGYDLDNNSNPDIPDILNLGKISGYKTYLFSPDSYAGIQEENIPVEDNIPLVTKTDGAYPTKIQKQQILNQEFSNKSVYFDTPYNYEDKEFYYTEIFDGNSSSLIQRSNNYSTYQSDYENAIIKENLSYHFTELEDNDKNKIKTHVAPGSVSLKFSSTPHILLNLQSEKIGKKFLLPTFNVDKEDAYETIADYKHFVWADVMQNEVKGYDSQSPDPDVVDFLSTFGDKHIVRGEWEKNNPLNSGVYSIWEEGEVYHSGDYFISNDLPFATGIDAESNTQVSSHKGDVRETVKSAFNNFVLKGLLLNAMKQLGYEDYVNECFINNLNPFAPGTSHTFVSDTPIEDGNVVLDLSDSKVTNRIIIGSYCYTENSSSRDFYYLYPERTGWNNVIGTCPTGNYASKDKLIEITFEPDYGEVDNIEIESLWVDIEHDDAIITTENNTIYAPELDTKQQRFIFTNDLNDIVGISWKHVRLGSGLIRPATGVCAVYNSSNPPTIVLDKIDPKKSYKDFSIKYEAPYLGDDNINYKPATPYLFLGEIYKNIKYKDLYGGIESENLRKLNWYPISDAKSLNDVSGDSSNMYDITETEGDTYYQRWDCLKTYPTTEEDKNQIVDITSFMVETHKNLDARTDKLRAQYELMSRPTNFNIFNTVYNQKNNIFEYTTDWTDLDSDNTPNKIVWSMSKNLFGDVDTWTNVTVENATRTKYPVTKLLHWNNQVLALTEHNMEIVNFNAKNLIPSDDNTFIELQNSRKVDGTVKLQNTYGTHNMSTLITEQGLYFIEDNEKVLLLFSGEGPKKIGMTKLLDWFHNNVVQGTHTFLNTTPFHLEYDNIHKDVYLKNDTLCLVYNESLGEFTSLLTYTGNYWLFNYGGNLYAYRLAYAKDNDVPYVGLYKMFAGNSYNKDFGRYWYNANQIPPDVFDDGDDLEYSVSYIINPNPYSDKVFTNGTIMADLGVTNTPNPLPNSTKFTDNPDSTVKEERDTPFDTLRAWTEYQDTSEVELKHILDKPSALKQKFRYWRFNIPRDINSPMKRDRIRNPWMHIQLKGRSNKKMEFHNLTIQYME